MDKTVQNKTFQHLEVSQPITLRRYDLEVEWGGLGPGKISNYLLILLGPKPPQLNW